MADAAITHQLINRVLLAPASGAEVVQEDLAD